MPQATRWANISRVAFENALLERNLPLIRIDTQYLAQECDGLSVSPAGSTETSPRFNPHRYTHLLDPNGLVPLVNEFEQLDG